MLLDCILTSRNIWLTDDGNSSHRDFVLDKNAVSIDSACDIVPANQGTLGDEAPRHSQLIYRIRVGQQDIVGSRTMNPTSVGMIFFACTLGGVLLGMWLRTILPERHLDNDSRDTVKLG